MSTLARDGAKMICSWEDLRLLQGETKDRERGRLSRDEHWKPVFPGEGHCDMPAVLTFSMCVDV